MVERSLSDMAVDRSYNRETNHEANTLHFAITNFQFVVTLVTVKNLMGYTKALSVNLQGRAQDVIHAYNSVNNVILTLNDVRANVDGKFKDWFSQACKMAEKVGVQPSTPRTCGRQQHRQNLPADTPEEYYRRTLMVPYTDELLSQLDTRFSSLKKVSSNGLYFIPDVIVGSPERLQERVIRFCNKYEGDIPSPLGLNVELELWERKWRRAQQDELAIPSTARAALKACNRNDFPNIYVLLKILCTIGVTSCETERANSELTYLKTYLRSTMGQERLSGLALMHVHYDMPIDIEQIVTDFARQHPRRLQLENLLSY